MQLRLNSLSSLMNNYSSIKVRRDNRVKNERNFLATATYLIADIRLIDHRLIFTNSCNERSAQTTINIPLYVRVRKVYDTVRNCVD